MLRIAICDDDRYITKRLSDYLMQYSFQHDCEQLVCAFSTAAELLETTFQYDVLFLDIMLDAGQDGIEIAKQLRKINSTPIIIIISSRADKHVDAINATIFRYIVKPFSQKQIDQIMDEAYQYLNKNERIFPIYFGKETHYVLLHDIIFVESYNRKRFVCTKDRTIKTTESWCSFMERISGESCFFKPHKTLLINLYHVRSNTKTEILMDTGKRVTLSKGGYYAFQEAYIKFLGDIR